MKTITLHGSTFTVRPPVVEIINEMKDLGFKNIQELVMTFLEVIPESAVHTDEYALAIAVYFEDSKAWREADRQSRCATDVRKYNTAVFKCMGNENPEVLVRHLDGGTRATKRNEKASLDALAEIADQLG